MKFFVNHNHEPNEQDETKCPKSEPYKASKKSVTPGSIYFKESREPTKVNDYLANKEIAGKIEQVIDP